MPDFVLPEQFQSSELTYRKVPGEAALLRAVLEDAIACFQQHATAPGRRAQRLAREAEEWLFTDDPRWPMSFTNVCAALGLDPDYLRMKLRQWCQRPPVSPGQEVKRSKGLKQQLSRIAP